MVGVYVAVGVGVSVGVGVGVSPVTVGVGVGVGVSVGVGVAVSVAVGVGVGVGACASLQLNSHSCCPVSVVPPVSTAFSPMQWPAPAGTETPEQEQFNCEPALTIVQQDTLVTAPLRLAQFSVEAIAAVEYTNETVHVLVGTFARRSAAEHVPKSAGTGTVVF